MRNFLSRLMTTAKYRLMVISCKGGVGKSTIAVNIAAALHARGKKVGIFDADIYGPNVPTLLGVSQKRNVSEGWVPVAVKDNSIDLLPITPIKRYGINIMSLGLLVGSQQTLNLPPAEIGNMTNIFLGRIDWQESDFVIIDMPPGTGEPLQTLVNNGLVDSILLVTVRENMAHVDNGRLLNFLRNTPVPIMGLIENMVHVKCPDCGALIELYPNPAANQEIYKNIKILASIPFQHELIRETLVGAPAPLNKKDTSAKEIFLTIADTIIENVGGTSNAGIHV